MITLYVQLSAETPLFIGSEVRLNTSASRPLLKTPPPHPKPYIPGTTVKGALRHATENFLQWIKSKYNLSDPPWHLCHSPQPENMCQFNDAADDCLVCQLFGSPWHESALFFEPLHLDVTAARILDTRTRMSVTMNRKRRVAMNQRLFDTELYETGHVTSYTGRISYALDEMWRLAPVLLSAKSIRTVGGSRSRGLGWVTVTTEHETTPDSRQSIELATLWQQWKREAGLDE